jgi:Ca-activated chloride channel family protein
MLTVEPPRRVAPAMIPPREYLFVVDVSGSMMGFPLDTAKAVVKALATQLRATDTFNILFFSGGSQTMAPAPVPATPENIAKAMMMMTRIDGGGGTELLPALRSAFSMPRYGSLSRSVIVVTDGYVTVEREALELIESHLGESNLFAFGIGSSVNRYLIEAMARAGRGTPFIVTDQSQATQVAEALTSYIRSPVLTQVKVAFKGFTVHDVEPAAVPDVLADRPVVVQGKWSGEARGTVTVTGVTGAGPFSQTFEVSKLKPRPENTALKYLWARERIARLSDFATIGEATEAERAEVTQLGLTYELLTKCTSFIAVLEDVRNHGAAATDVEQPLPLPAGVAESAVGGSTGAEPDFVVMLVVMLAVVAVALRRRTLGLA